jgi:hypothetical protein
MAQSISKSGKFIILKVIKLNNLHKDLQILMYLIEIFEGTVKYSNFNGIIYLII